MEYPFDRILINNREIFLDDIRNGTVTGQNDFEVSTFNFIRQWFSDDETFTLHTSGSTGTPKPIELHRDQMMASARATAEALGLHQGDHCLVCLDTRFIAGQMMLVRAFLTGMSIEAVTPSANPLESASDRKISFIALVPLQVNKILESRSALRLNDINSVIIGGASLADNAISELQRYGCMAYATYGMTETVSHVALRRLNGPDKSEFFHTLPGIRITSDDRSCLVINCSFLEEDVVTNDIVQILNPTSFRWLGRADNIINSGGVKISPEQVEKLLESALRSLNLHHRFIVSGAYDISLGNKVILVVESQPVEFEVKTRILDEARRVMNRYMVPKEVRTLEAFPETPTGKIDRRKIAELVNKQQ